MFPEVLTVDMRKTNNKIKKHQQQQRNNKNKTTKQNKTNKREREIIIYTDLAGITVSILSVPPY